MKAIILAAGYATRLYPLTKDQPKALLPIGGKPILDYLMEQITSIPQIDEAHIVSNHRFIPHFTEWLQGARGRYAPLSLHVWDDETTSDGDKLGAIGDIQFVLERAKLDDDLLVAASDNFFTFPLADMVRDFTVHGCDTICATRMSSVQELRRMAVATLSEQRRVLRLEEKPEQPHSDVGVYAIYLYRRDTLPLFAQYLADPNNSPDAPGHFPEWLYRQREVRAFLFDGPCYDIGTVQAYADIQEEFARGAFRSLGLHKA